MVKKEIMMLVMASMASPVNISTIHQQRNIKSNSSPPRHQISQDIMRLGLCCEEREMNRRYLSNQPDVGIPTECQRSSVMIAQSRYSIRPHSTSVSKE